MISGRVITRINFRKFENVTVSRRSRDVCTRLQFPYLPAICAHVRAVDMQMAMLQLLPVYHNPKYVPSLRGIDVHVDDSRGNRSENLKNNSNDGHEDESSCGVLTVRDSSFPWEGFTVLSTVRRTQQQILWFYVCV